MSTVSLRKPRKTVTYAEQLQSLQKPKDAYYTKPSMGAFVVVQGPDFRKIL